MDGIKIDDRIINPDHIVYVDLNVQVPGFGQEKMESAVKIVLSVEEDVESLGLYPKTLTYTGVQASALRPFLHKMFPCRMRSIRLPIVEDAKLPSKPGPVCLLDTCNVGVSRNGYFCSDECAELFEEQIPF